MTSDNQIPEVNAIRWGNPIDKFHYYVHKLTGHERWLMLKDHLVQYYDEVINQILHDYFITRL